MTTAPVLDGRRRTPADSNQPVHVVLAEAIRMSLCLRDEEAQLLPNLAASPRGKGERVGAYLRPELCITKLCHGHIMLRSGSAGEPVPIPVRSLG